jgi:hypothetical protein
VPTSETVAEQVPIVVAVEEAEPQPESAAVVEEES